LTNPDGRNEDSDSFIFYDANKFGGNCPFALYARKRYGLWGYLLGGGFVLFHFILLMYGYWIWMLSADQCNRLDQIHKRRDKNEVGKVTREKEEKREERGGN
jgi:hypothetical protein